MPVATPGHAVEWRATIATFLGRGFALPDKAPFIDRAAVEQKRAEP